MKVQYQHMDLFIPPTMRYKILVQVGKYFWQNGASQFRYQGISSMQIIIGRKVKFFTHISNASPLLVLALSTRQMSLVFKIRCWHLSSDIKKLGIDPTWEMICRCKGSCWNFTTFMSPDIHYDIVILFAKVLSSRPQVDILFQPLIFWVTILLVRNYRMGCKCGNTYTGLSPYTTPTYILMNIKKKKARVKMRMIKKTN